MQAFLWILAVVMLIVAAIASASQVPAASRFAAMLGYLAAAAALAGYAVPVFKVMAG